MTTAFIKIIEGHRAALEKALMAESADRNRVRAIVRAEFKSLRNEIDGALSEITDRIKQIAIDLWLSGGSINLIWLDDEVEKFNSIILELSEYGINIVPTTSIASARAAINDQIDGVILDVVLENGEDGFQFLRSLHAEHLHLPVVLCSKYGLRAAVQRRGIELGALGAIKKTEIENPQLAIILHEFFTAEKQVSRVRDIVLSRDRKLESLVGRWAKSKKGIKNQTAIDREFTNLQTELTRQRKSPPRILAILRSLKSILEHAAGDVVGEELLEGISEILT